MPRSRPSMPDRRWSCAAGSAGHAGAARADSPGVGLIGDFAAAAGGNLTAFLRAEHAGAVTESGAGETDFAVIVYREEDQWEADALPAALTADLDGLVQALRQQPSIGGTI